MHTTIKKETIRRIELSLLCGFLITVVLSVTSFASACADIRQDVLRMHVIANSDSEADQTVKLQVRDAVLEAGETLFDGSLTAADAGQILQEDVDALEHAANRVLAENGFAYSAQVEIGKDFFATRTYDGTATLPAGEYMAVRVILGAGQGQNWWCVMFPPMCLPAAESEAQLEDVLTDREEKIVESNPKYEARFKIVEFFEKLSEKIK